MGVGEYHLAHRNPVDAHGYAWILAKEPSPTGTGSTKTKIRRRQKAVAARMESRAPLKRLIRSAFKLWLKVKRIRVCNE